MTNPIPTPTPTPKPSKIVNKWKGSICLDRGDGAGIPASQERAFCLRSPVRQLIPKSGEEKSCSRCLELVATTVTKEE